MALTYPTISAGQRITGALLQALTTQAAVKSSATSRVTSTVVNDPDLQFPVVAGGLYLVEFGVSYSGIIAGSLRTQWGVPSGTSGVRMCHGPGSTTNNADADNITGRFGGHQFTTPVTYSCARNSTSNTQALTETCYITVGSTAGNIVFQWGQATTNATATTVGIPSWGRCTRIG
jgi:hypothetical protein